MLIIALKYGGEELHVIAVKYKADSWIPHIVSGKMTAQG